jgi:hypothetical protein
MPENESRPGFGGFSGSRAHVASIITKVELPPGRHDGSGSSLCPAVKRDNYGMGMLTQFLDDLPNVSRPAMICDTSIVPKGGHA